MPTEEDAGQKASECDLTSAKPKKVVLPWLARFNCQELKLQYLRRIMHAPPTASASAGKAKKKTKAFSESQVTLGTGDKVSPSKKSKVKSSEEDMKREHIVFEVRKKRNGVLNDGRLCLRFAIQKKFGFTYDYITENGGLQTCRKEGVFIEILDDDEVT